MIPYKSYPDKFGPPSPWGRIQHSYNFEKGIRLVDTASHGGFMLSKKFAEENISFTTLKDYPPLEFGNFLCYEEDCAIEIVLYELINKDPNKWKPIFEEIWPGGNYYTITMLQQNYPKILQRVFHPTGESHVHKQKL